MYNKYMNLITEQKKELFKSIEKETKYITTSSIIGFCLNGSNILPKNNADIFNFISHLKMRGCLIKLKQGTYLINWDKVGLL